MSAEIDFPPELFSLLERLAAIGRKLREQKAENEKSRSVDLDHGGNSSNHEQRANND